MVFCGPVDILTFRMVCQRHLVSGCHLTSFEDLQTLIGNDSPQDDMKWSWFVGFVSKGTSTLACYPVEEMSFSQLEHVATCPSSWCLRNLLITFDCRYNRSKFTTTEAILNGPILCRKGRAFSSLRLHGIYYSSGTSALFGIPRPIGC